MNTQSKQDFLAKLIFVVITLAFLYMAVAGPDQNPSRQLGYLFFSGVSFTCFLVLIISDIARWIRYKTNYQFTYLLGFLLMFLIIYLGLYFIFIVL